MPGRDRLAELAELGDWRTSALGEPAAWPAELRTAAYLCLEAALPVLIGWGPDLAALYNDEFRPFLEDRHPAYGRPLAEVLPGQWGGLGQDLSDVARTGQPFVAEGVRLALPGTADLPAPYFTVHARPLRTRDGLVGGVYCVLVDTTAAVLSRRRQLVLRALPEAVLGVRTAGEAARVVAEAIRAAPDDIATALIYLVDTALSVARLAAWEGIEPQAIGSEAVDLGSMPPAAEEDPIAAHVRETASSARPTFFELPLPAGPVPALALPATIPDDRSPSGVLVVTPAESHLLTEDFRDFAERLAFGLASALASARRYRESKEFAAHFGLAGVGNAQVDVATRAYVRVNPAFCELVGRPEGQIIGRPFREISGVPEDDAAEREVLRSLIAGELPSVTYERKFRRPDGATVCALVVATVAVRDERGEPERVGAVLIDVTDRQRAEAARAASEARYRALAHATTHSLFRLSADGQELLEVYGGTARPHSGTPQPYDRWLQEYLHPDEQEAIYRDWMRAVPRGEIHEAEVRARREDGSWGWMLARAVPIRNRQGQVVEWVGSATDITERRQAEEDLRAANATMNEFLSVASHELRNPVAAVHGMAQMLVRSRASGRLTPERLDHYITSLQENTAFLARLTEDLLDVTRLQQGRLPLRMQSVDPGALLEELVAAEGWPGRVVVRRRFRDSLPRVRLDPHRFRQIVANLVENALKYSPESAPVVLELRVVDLGVRIDVVDRGIGIPPEAEDLIFRPFGRAANAVNSEVAGLGLGLYIARQIAQQHGGWLRSESAGADQGTRMMLWLPPASAEDRGGPGSGQG